MSTTSSTNELADEPAGKKQCLSTECPVSRREHGPVNISVQFRGLFVGVSCTVQLGMSGLPAPMAGSTQVGESYP